MVFHKFRCLEQLVWFNVLLGTRYLPTEWLLEFYGKLMKRQLKWFNKKDIELDDIVRCVREFVSLELVPPISSKNANASVFWWVCKFYFLFKLDMSLTIKFFPKFFL